MKTREFEVLVTKLKLQTRDTGDRHAFFVYEGRVITRTKRSHGYGEMPDYWIRQQLKVNERQLAELIGCTLKLDDYISILKSKGLI
jgi:hypothetical protein